MASPATRRATRFVLLATAVSRRRAVAVTTAATAATSRPRLRSMQATPRQCGTARRSPSHPRVVVTNAAGPMAGVTVTFTVTAGGGTRQRVARRPPTRRGSPRSAAGRSGPRRASTPSGPPPAASRSTSAPRRSPARRPPSPSHRATTRPGCRGACCPRLRRWSSRMVSSPWPARTWSSPWRREAAAYRGPTRPPARDGVAAVGGLAPRHHGNEHPDRDSAGARRSRRSPSPLPLSRWSSPAVNKVDGDNQTGFAGNFADKKATVVGAEPVRPAHRGRAGRRSVSVAVAPSTRPHDDDGLNGQAAAALVALRRRGTRSRSPRRPVRRLR